MTMTSTLQDFTVTSSDGLEIVARFDENGKPLRYRGYGHPAPNGKPFVWGPVLRIHEVTDTIRIVEYAEDKSRSRQPEYYGEHGQIRFHPYVLRSADRFKDEPYWYDQSTSYKSLEGAIIGAIANVRLGPNAGRYAAGFIADMLKIEEF